MSNDESIETLYIDLKVNDKASSELKKIKEEFKDLDGVIDRGFSERINFALQFYHNYLPYRMETKSISFSDYNLTKPIWDSLENDIDIKIQTISNVFTNMQDKIIKDDHAIYWQALKDLIAYGKQKNAEQENLTIDYYNRMKFLDSNYYTFRLNLINQEANDFEKALGLKFDRASFVTSEMLKLNKERDKFLLDWAKSDNTQKQDKWPIPRRDYNLPRPHSDSNYPLTDSWLINPMSIDFTPLKTVKVPEKPPVSLEHQSELIKDIIKNSVVASLGFENLSKALAQSLSLIRINLSENASAMEKIWGGMINSMIEDISALVSKWLVMNTIAGIFGLGTGFGAVTFDSLLGIQKLAGGGDFVVPPGFPNDSYPILVQSGERVRVTPSASTAPETKLLSEIRDALYALNINSTAGTRQNPVTLKLFLDGRELAKSNELLKSSMKREGFIPGEF